MFLNENFRIKPSAVGVDVRANRLYRQESACSARKIANLS